MQLRRWRFLFLLVVASSLACRGWIVGDPTQDLEIHNASDITVVVYEEGRAAPASKLTKFTLDPGKTTITGRIVLPPDSSGKLEGGQKIDAEDEAGNLVFCRKYTNEELKGLKWRVEIVKGQVLC
ncbi:MAG: hypothetical protein HY690_06120 [Chloroflexi bacterium]|nr:hypothetical protein [Chloroflexota bacterium]